MAKHTWVVFLCWHIKYNIISCQTLYINALQRAHTKAKKRKMSKEKQGLCKGFMIYLCDVPKVLHSFSQTPLRNLESHTRRALGTQYVIWDISNGSWPAFHNNLLSWSKLM
jgi:hypothetical protein